MARTRLVEQYESYIKTLVLPKITLYAIKVNAKLNSIHGENREPGWLSFDRWTGEPTIENHPISCSLQSMEGALLITDKYKDSFLSSGYEFVELNF